MMQIGPYKPNRKDWIMGKVLAFNVGGRQAKPKYGQDDVYDDEGLQALENAINKNGGKKISEKDAKKLARFERDFKKLRKKYGADENDFRADTNTRAMYHAMMQMIIAAIPLAQEQIYTKKNESSVYALNALVNQAKELSREIRSLDDLEGQAKHIEMEILNPNFIVLVNSLLPMFTYLKGKVDSTRLKTSEKVALKKEIDKTLREIANYSQQMCKSMASSVERYMIGD